MLLVKAMLTDPPLQMVAAVVLVITGTGFMVTVTVWVAPTQPPGLDVGVTVYTTVCEVVVVLVMVLFMVLPEVAVVLSPVVLALLFAIHEYVEDTLLVKEILSGTPLHTLALVVLVITGIGFTATVTV